MTNEELDEYFRWYHRGSVTAFEINAIVEKIRKGFVSSDEDFLEDAFFDGLRDKLKVDPFND